MSSSAVRVADASTLNRLAALAGIAAGPLFLVVTLLQLPFNEGIDLTRHAFSFLTLGPIGWLQQANFVVVGCLYACSSVAVGNAVGGRLGGFTAVLMAVIGGGMVLSGLFVPDPSYGYPPGAPHGAPAELSTSSMVHGVAFMASVLAWLSLLVTLTGWYRRRGRRGWAWATTAFGVALLLVPPLSATSFGGLVIYAVVGPGYVFMSVLIHNLTASQSSRWR
ncbi:DUF998 domain-containing protein [Agromyces sp. NPDC049794]|uniref:DUF998 domain-containing protein n=1 Tax=unclassified Agromyces TaxID=2639701 RepID=UPI0033C0AA1B